MRRFPFQKIHGTPSSTKFCMYAVCISLALSVIGAAYGQQTNTTGPRALIVIAHPDDESSCAATVYKMTHDLGGVVDLALITNGEGGYKYSTLGEAIYGLELTDEAIGRQHLPRIRKKELMAGGAIIGIRDYFFFDQKDHKYTLDVDETLDSVWNVEAILARLQGIIERGQYDYIFAMLPTEGTHGHHKGATILALRAVQQLPHNARPIVLGVSGGSKSDTTNNNYSGLEGYPITHINPDAPIFTFDRTQKFGYKDRLDYNIIVNWLIAEHKSQGTMQLYMNRAEVERFWYFALNDPAGINRVRRLFEDLHVIRYVKKQY